MATLGEYLGAGSGTTKLLLHLNGNSTDTSGNSNSGSDTNITYSQANGKFGQGAGFNGSSSLINLGSNLIYERTQAFTVSAWIKTSTSNGYRAIYGYTRTTTPFPGFAMFSSFNSGNKLFFYMDAAGTSIRIAGSTSLADGTWKNCIITYNGSSSSNGVNMYVNGSLETKNVVTNTLSSSILGASAVFVGASRVGGDLYEGNIDEVIVENRAWTPQEVAKYYTYSNGRFATL